MQMYEPQALVGLQNWKFDERGYMKERWASINDVPIQESERQFRWPRQ